MRLRCHAFACGPARIADQREDLPIERGPAAHAQACRHDAPRILRIGHAEAIAIDSCGGSSARGITSTTGAPADRILRGERGATDKACEQGESTKRPPERE
jgi:hypothetical protein